MLPDQHHPKRKAVSRKACTTQRDVLKCCLYAQKTPKKLPERITVTTTNTYYWQRKAITLFITALAFCLITACGEDSVTEYSGGDRIIPSAPCGPDMSLIAAVEFRELPHREALSDGTINTLAWNEANKARLERIGPEIERVEAILARHIDGILSQHWEQTKSLRQSRTNKQTNGYYLQLAPQGEVAALKNEKGLPTDKLVIEVSVQDFMDQSAFSPDDRLPECLEGIEVHYVVVGEITYLNELKI